MLHGRHIFPILYCRFSRYGRPINLCVYITHKSLLENRYRLPARGGGVGERREKAYGIGLVRGLECLLIACSQLRGFRCQSLCGLLVGVRLRALVWWREFQGLRCRFLYTDLSTTLPYPPLYGGSYYGGPYCGLSTLITQSVKEFTSVRSRL